jgi:hypothetical protein
MANKEFHPDEIANSKRIQKSATPKHDVSWYVKWVASCFILSSMSIRGIDGLDRQSVEKGKSVDLGGRRIIQKKT